MIVAPRNLPVPVADPITAPFWQGCSEGHLLVQHCRACDHFQAPPAPCCSACGGPDFDWIESSGKGSVFTYSIAWHAAFAALADQLPYVIVVVTLDDCGGTRLVSNLVDCELDDVKIGVPVTLVWSGDPQLPRFTIDRC